MVQEDLKSFHTQIEQDRQSHANSIKTIIDDNATQISTLHTAFHTQIEQDRQSHASSIKAIIDENATRLSTLHTALTTGLASLSGAPPENTPSVNKVVDSGGASNSSRTLGLGSLNGTFEHDVPGSRPRDSLEFIDTFEYDISASRSSFNDTSGSESSPSTTFPAHKFHTSGAFVDDVPASRSYTSHRVSALSRRFPDSLSSPGNKLYDLSVLIEEKRASSNVAPSSKNRIQSANVTPSRKRSGSIMAKPTEKRVYTGRVTPSKNMPTRTTRSTRAKAKALTPDARRLLRMFKPSKDFERFKGIKETGTNYLLLSGRNGKMAIRKTDYNVNIGALRYFIPGDQDTVEIPRFAISFVTHCEEEVYDIWYHEYRRALDVTTSAGWVWNPIKDVLVMLESMPPGTDWSELDELFALARYKDEAKLIRLPS
ncbi:uncharacterized protein BKA78DRAFT_351618 [Phyllosticta capitalensis]|uniref:uncharacterized protein n=1 Tax=Phyllosticta capitalensis TaxID=121624 RepID=UPI00312F69CC